MVGEPFTAKKIDQCRWVQPSSPSRCSRADGRGALRHCTFVVIELEIHRRFSFNEYRNRSEHAKRTTTAFPLKVTTVCDLLQRHFQTLVEDNAQWQMLITDDVVWQLPYAPAIGHPAQLSGREEVVRHVTWFVGAVENFRFYDLKVHAFADPEAAVAEVKAEGLIKPTGRIYLQDYVLFLRAAGDKIAFLREHFDPVRPAKAMDTRILGLEP